MKIEVDVEIPDGFEATGEVRSATRGEWFLNWCGEVSCCDFADVTPFCFIILRKKPVLKWPEWANDPAWDWMQAMALDPVGNSFTIWGYSTKELSYDAGEQMWVSTKENYGSFRFPWLLIDTIYPPDIKPENSLIVRPTASHDAKHVTGHVATDYNPT